jgi:hypothetical protein
MKSNQLVIIIGIVIILILIIYLCSSKSHKDGYTRTPLGLNCQFRRTPVDFAMNGEDGWQTNPHWMADPSDKYQPLDFGPVDLFKEERKLENGSNIFEQYTNDWEGPGNGKVYLMNDNKTRSLLTEVGDMGIRRVLDDEWGPRFGQKGFSNTEISQLSPDPYTADHALYGGMKFLKYRVGQ